MKGQKGSIKYTLIASLVSVALLVLAALVYAHFTQPTTPGTVSQVPQTIESKRIVAVGDIVCSPVTGHTPGDCEHSATASIAEQLNPDAVLLLGDLQYDSGKLADFNVAFDSTWGKFNDKAYPAPGNHEYTTQDAAGYYDYFGERAGDPSKGYYSFNLGNWHIIALNSNCKMVSCDPESEQGQWLKADIAANAQVCSLAFWHHPAFSSGRYATRSDQLALGQELWQQVAGKVDVVLNGHDHLYERLLPSDGTQQFTVGAGGRSHYSHDPANLSEFSQKIIDDAYGVLSVSLNAESYTWQFIGIDGSTLDQGQQNCNN